MWEIYSRLACFCRSAVILLFVNKQVALIIAITWATGLVYNLLHISLTTEITPQCLCSAISSWPNRPTKAIVGFLTYFVEFLLPSGALMFFYSRTERVLSQNISELAPLTQQQGRHVMHGLLRGLVTMRLRHACGISTGVSTQYSTTLYLVCCWSAARQRPVWTNTKSVVGFIFFLVECVLPDGLEKHSLSKSDDFWETYDATQSQSILGRQSYNNINIYINLLFTVVASAAERRQCRDDKSSITHIP